MKTEVEVDDDWADAFVVARLKQDARNLLESLGEESWGDKDKDDFAADLDHVLGTLNRWMPHTEYEAFVADLYGSDTPSFPQCDDEFMVELEGDGEVEITVYLDSDTVDVLERTAKLDGRTPEEVAPTLLCLEAAKVEISRD